MWWMKKTPYWYIVQIRIEHEHVSKASRVNMCTDLEVPFVNDKWKRTHNSAIVGFGFSYIVYCTIHGKDHGERNVCSSHEFQMLTLHELISLFYPQPTTCGITLKHLYITYFTLALESFRLRFRIVYLRQNTIPHMMPHN